MGSFVQQVRHAARSLARTPGFTITAAVTLATGIGLSVAAFTIANALLIRRLPVGQQDRLVVLWGETHDGRFSNWPLPLDDIREFQRRSHTLGDIAFFTFRGATPLPVRIADRVYPVKDDIPVMLIDEAKIEE